MKIKSLTVILAAFVVMAAAGAALAQPPGDISLSWDGASGTLSVSAQHPVNDKTKHFVMMMTVSKDGDALVTKKYTSQASDGVFSDKVQLKDVKPGDKLAVELTCNIMGTTTKEITIGS